MIRPRLPSLLFAAALVLGACAGSPATQTPSTPAPSAAAASPSASTAAGGQSSCPTSQPAAMPAGQSATVSLETPKGTIVIQVQGSLGPNAAGNFVALAKCGYFDGVVFHRLVPGFVIQGGDGQFGREPNVDTAHVGQGGPGYAFADDPVSGSDPYARGTVAMANSGPNTNGSQFFICLADVQLPPAYSVFGKVTQGMDVVDAIGAMPNSGGQENLALQPVPITKATVTP